MDLLAHRRNVADAHHDAGGRAFRVAVAAALVVGATVAATVTGQVAQATHTLDLVSVVPARLLETRTGPNETTIDGEFEGIGRRSAGATVELTVAGRGGVPVDATAVFLNLTAITPSAPGFLTAYPCGAKRPQTSNVNYGPGDVAPNAVLSKIGTGGKVCIYTLAATDIIADVNGYVPVNGTPESVVPARLLETRTGPDETTADGEFEGIGRRGAGSTVELTVAGRGGVPSDADAVFLNLTAITPSAPGFLTAYPCGAKRPTTSNVNYGPGDIAPNAVLAKIGTGGKVCIYTLAAADIIADVNGFVPKGGTPGTSVPARILETRVGPDLTTADGLFEGIGKRSAGSTLELTVAGRGGVPADADAAFLNVTAIFPDALGFITVFPCGAPRPQTSNINYFPGDVAPNSVLAKIGEGGKVCIYTLAAADIIVDVSGHVPEPALEGLIDVSFGKYHGCGLDDDGGVTCWGERTSGALGIGDTSRFAPRNSALPVRIPNLTGVTDLEVNDGFSCAVLADATAACWGDNTSGQLGNGSTTNRDVPTKVSGLSGVEQISAGGRHACALLVSDVITCWGYGLNGQLGDGAQVNRSTPVTVAGLPAGKTPIAVDAGTVHTCALFSDGTAACWGGNGGRLGDGTTVTSPTPVVVLGLTGAVEIGAGSTHSCARIAGGTVQCWGPNNQIGNGVTLGVQSSPVTVAGLAGVTSISVGDYTCVTVTGGGAKCWGINSFGRLGNQVENGTELTPVTVTATSEPIALIDVADGGNATCAVLADGTGVCWGRNFDRELGIDTEGRAPSLVAVVVGSTGLG